MHAARAIHKQREKRDEKPKLDVRRPSAISQYSRNLQRSPVVSVDAKKSLNPSEESENLNISYIGFIIAVFGAVPLIVGTFVEVPVLWELGLGVTLLGLFIGVVFWCSELCAEAKRFSQKKNQLSSRGKIEDSNLLQVPDRKFGNGMESRRSSFQSDSVSLISPAVQHYTPKHPNLQDGRNSISQYSSDYSTPSSRANGHLVPPALILRGNGRKDDGRVVSLVQPDPGLDDDSDSDAETVIEAPISHSTSTKIIQVQSCLEKHHPQIASHHQRPHPGNTLYGIENEKISPNSQQHRIFRIPVLPQEVDKLQRCECGRYLLTERDKLIGIRLPGISGSSSGSTTKSNSPTPLTSLLPFAAAGGNPTIARKNKPPRGNLGLNLEDANETENNDISCIQDSTTPLADQPPPPPPKIINENPTVKIAPTIPPTPQNTGSHTTQVESVLDPSISSPGDFLTVVPTRIKTENLDGESDDDDDDGEVTPGNESGKTFQECEVLVEEGRDKILSELLELTDINDEERLESVGNEPEQLLQSIEPMELVEERETPAEEVSNDENHNTEDHLKISREGSRRKTQYQAQVSSINRPRPTSLPLPISMTDRDVEDPLSNDDVLAEDGDNNEPEDIVQTESLTTVLVSTEDNDADKAEGQEQVDPVNLGNSTVSNQGLEEDMTLDELLDSIEQTQDKEVLAVVVL